MCFFKDSLVAIGHEQSASASNVDPTIPDDHLGGRVIVAVSDAPDQQPDACKNSLFTSHNEGARAWARIASLVKMAKINEVKHHAFLKATLEAIAAAHPAFDIDALTP